MLIVGCLHCGETKVLAGAPGVDGTALVKWICTHCGAGNVLEVTPSIDVRGTSLHAIVGGLALIAPNDSEEVSECEDTEVELC